MATTIALLNPAAWMMTGWKCKGKGKGKMPSCSLKQQVTSNNFPSSSFKYVNNNQLSSRWLLSMAQYHPITTIVPNNTNLFSNYCTSSNLQQDADVLFTADKPPHSCLNFVDMLSRILASVFTFIIIMAASNSALAASYGRMGGSSSPRSSSRRSSPSLYLSNSYHDADHFNDYSISSRFKHTTCTCGGNSEEVKHTCTCDPNCTHCNCDIEEKGNKQLQEQSTHRSCSCNCHKTCYFHKKIDHSHAYILLAFIILALISVLLTPTLLIFSHNNPPLAETVNNHQPTEIVTGIMFQVGVSDKERKLQRKLNKIAENAYTSTLNGLNYVLKEVVGALVQHDNSSFLFSNFFAKFSSMEIVSERFQKILNMELDRYDRDENSLVNVDGVKYKKKTDMVKANSIIDNEYTVATIMVLATGRYSIPYYKNKEKTCIDCVAVLQTLQRIPKNKIQSIEVFWSPQREDDVLLEEDLRRDFPLMKSIKNGHLFVNVKNN